MKTALSLDGIIFLPHFHYNKDWNYSIGVYSIWRSRFLPHFHYNKDWNLKHG